MLLDHLHRNIDLNASSNNGRTAFMFACMKGYHNVVKLQVRNKVEWPPSASEVMEVKIECPRSNGMDLYRGHIDCCQIAPGSQKH